MKKVMLKTVPVDNSVDLDYRSQMIEALSRPQNAQAGTDYAEMAKVLPLIRKLEKAEGKPHILLEDTEHQLISERLKSQKFAINHPSLFEMISDIVEATEAAELKEA